MVPVGEVEEIATLANIQCCKVGGVCQRIILGMPVVSHSKAGIAWNPIFEKMENMLVG